MGEKRGGGGEAGRAKMFKWNRAFWCDAAFYDQAVPLAQRLIRWFSVSPSLSIPVKYAPAGFSAILLLFFLASLSPLASRSALHCYQYNPIWALEGSMYFYYALVSGTTGVQLVLLVQERPLPVRVSRPAGFMGL